MRQPLHGTVAGGGWLLLCGDGCQQQALVGGEEAWKTEPATGGNTCHGWDTEVQPAPPSLTADKTETRAEQGQRLGSGEVPLLLRPTNPTQPPTQPPQQTTQEVGTPGGSRPRTGQTEKGPNPALLPVPGEILARSLNVLVTLASQSSPDSKLLVRTRSEWGLVMLRYL